MPMEVNKELLVNVIPPVQIWSGINDQSNPCLKIAIFHKDVKASIQHALKW